MSVFCKLTKENQPVCYRYGRNGIEQTYTYTDMPFQLLFDYEMLLFPLAKWSPVLERNKHMSYGISMSANLDTKQVEQLVELKERHIPRMAIASLKNSTEIFLPAALSKSQNAAFLSSAICIMNGETAPTFDDKLSGATELCHSMVMSEDNNLPLPFRAAKREQLGNDVFIIRFHAEDASTLQHDGWVEEHYSRFGEQDPARYAIDIAVASSVLKRYGSNMFAFSNEIRQNTSVAEGIFSKADLQTRSFWRHIVYRALSMSIPEAWSITPPTTAPSFCIEV